MVQSAVSAPAPRRVALMLESDGPGGAEVMLFHLADELRRRGHYVLPVGPQAGSGWLAERFRERGFEPATFMLRSPVDVRCWRDLVALLRDRRIDVVHSHEFTMGVYGGFAANSLSVPHVITMHGGRYYAQRWRRRAALGWAAARSRALVGVSDATADDLKRTLPSVADRVRVVPNGIPFAAGHRAGTRAALGLGDANRLILAVGNLYHVKGHDVLLRAFARIANEAAASAWTVAIAGRGEAEASLRQLAADLGIADRVQLLGLRSDVPDLLAAADLFTLPSRSEGLPLALIEAMGASLPIVSTEVGGIAEVVRRDVEALLVPPENPAQMASALATLIGDPDRRLALGAAARRRATSAYSVESMGDRYEALYNAAPDNASIE
ncbi:MAG TPA: glycosyltransferase [Gemmatimonadaceae bacterium]|nr:glycosyltransferase [Gemmatimonadaceae bacterium]